MNKRRRVTFDSNVSMKVVPKIPEEYRDDIWMVKDDYIRIRRACAEDVVQVLVHGTDCSDDHCLRGLEACASDEDFVRSYELRKESIVAVLEEQKFQRETGYRCPEDIATAYKEVSALSIAHAFLVAERDEVAAREGASSNGIQW